MPTNANTEWWGFDSFSGVDIIGIFNGVQIAEFLGIRVAVTTEMAPIFVMGDKYAKGMATGKVGLTGTLAFQFLDRDALIHALGNRKVWRSPFSDMADGRSFDDIMSKAGLSRNWGFGSKKRGRPMISSEIPPFTITLTGVNARGKSTTMSIYGVVLPNESFSMTINDLTLQTAYTFIAASFSPWTNGVAQTDGEWATSPAGEADMFNRGTGTTSTPGAGVSA